MPEMLAELNAKIPAERRTINLYSDGFNICFDYDSFSNKSIATISHGVSIKMEGLDLTMRLGFKEKMKIYLELHSLYLGLRRISNDIQRYMSIQISLRIS